jgi:hypothetical protein
MKEERKRRVDHMTQIPLVLRLFHLWLDMSLASPPPVAKSPPLEKKDPGKSSLLLHASAY